MSAYLNDGMHDVMFAYVYVCVCMCVYVYGRAFLILYVCMHMSSEFDVCMSFCMCVWGACMTARQYACLTV